MADFDSNIVMQMLMERFDRVDKDNDDIKKSVEKHIEDDAKVHAVVAKHNIYWAIVIGLATPIVLGVAVAWVTGFLK